ncbi:MAG: glutamate ligase domain-containing protein, partial [Candidatus Limnocylindrales bacterium]
MTRTVEEIGRGLEPTRPARPIQAGERIHVMGAAGSAGAASLLLGQAAGALVSGCDSGEPSAYSHGAESAGILIDWRHDPAHVIDADGRPRVDWIAVSKALTSVNPDQPELVAAHAAGIPATSCQQLIADAAATLGGSLLAVAGTHGKSTTTGWLVHLLAEAGEDPWAFVGALLPAALVGGPEPSVVRPGRPGGPFVVEADEYAGNFDPYRPSIGVVLNADWDHPDVFADRAAVVDVFEAWIRRFGPSPTVVANAGDAGLATLLPRLADWPGQILATSVARAGQGAADLADRLVRTVRSGRGPAMALTADYDDAATAAQGRARLVIHGLPGQPDGAPVEVQLAGRHNADDALGAAGAALAYGVEPAAILAGLASFRGVGRRFEVKAEAGGIVVIDDYGHHPTAIAATLDTVRRRYPGRRLWAVYEPLTFHRTAALLEPFADVLAGAERVAIADIFAVRDPDRTIVSAADLVRAVERRGTPALAPGSAEATADAVLPLLDPGDVVLVMGGGRSTI